jgi:AcrR family transcriptional regulator
VENPKLEPRNRPRQARSRKRVSFILDTAEQLALQFGNAAVTTQMISHATKISPGVLYHYFPGKHGIFAAIVQRVFIKLENRMRGVYATISQDQPAVEFMDEVMNSLVAFWYENRAAMLMWYGLEYDPQMDPITSAGKAEAIKRNSILVRTYLPQLSKGDVAIKALIMEEVSLCLLRQTLFLKPRDSNKLVSEMKDLLLFVISE